MKINVMVHAKSVKEIKHIYIGRDSGGQYCNGDSFSKRQHCDSAGSQFLNREYNLQNHHHIQNEEEIKM